MFKREIDAFKALELLFFLNNITIIHLHYNFIFESFQCHAILKVVVLLVRASILLYSAIKFSNDRTDDKITKA